jgi:uncharacterized protein (TIGR02266 family)
MRTPVTLKIKFKSATLDQFIERYSVDVSRGGIFIRTKEPLPVGTQLRFEFQLQDAQPLIGGEGTVVWIREHDPSRTGVAPGMGVRFDKLAPQSQGVLDKILSEKQRQDTRTPEARFDLGVRQAPPSVAGAGRSQPGPEARPRATVPPASKARTPLPAAARAGAGANEEENGDFGPHESTRVMLSAESDELRSKMREEPHETAQPAPPLRTTTPRPATGLRVARTPVPPTSSRRLPGGAGSGGRPAPAPTAAPAVPPTTAPLPFSAVSDSDGPEAVEEPLVREPFVASDLGPRDDVGRAPTLLAPVAQAASAPMMEEPGPASPEAAVPEAATANGSHRAGEWFDDDLAHPGSHPVDMSSERRGRAALAEAAPLATESLDRTDSVPRLGGGRSSAVPVVVFGVAVAAAAGGYLYIRSQPSTTARPATAAAAPTTAAAGAPTAPAAKPGGTAAPTPTAPEPSTTATAKEGDPAAAAPHPEAALPRWVTVASTPGGADVFVDGRRVGTTPITLKSLNFATAHKVELRKLGFDVSEREVQSGDEAWRTRQDHSELALEVELVKKTPPPVAAVEKPSPARRVRKARLPGEKPEAGPLPVATPPEGEPSEKTAAEKPEKTAAEKPEGERPEGERPAKIEKPEKPDKAAAEKADKPAKPDKAREDDGAKPDLKTPDWLKK